jgi:hypothetical protein
MLSQVAVRIGGGIGIVSPTSDFGGTSSEYYSGSRYGLNSGFNVHGKAKLGLAGWDLSGELGYSSLGGNGYSEPGQGSVDMTTNILSLKIGPELRIAIPAFPATPYIGAHVAMNRFSGETTFQGVSKVPSATYSVRAATRLGAGLTLGAEVDLGPGMFLDLSVSYNLMNLSGREWSDANPGVDQRLDTYVSLNDAPDPQYAVADDKHIVAGERSIQSLRFTVSILFGL